MPKSNDIPAARTLSTRPFTYAHAGADFTVASFGSLSMGALRKARHLDSLDQAFTLIESLVTDADTLAVLDSMNGDEFAAFVTAWQAAAGADAKN